MLCNLSVENYALIRKLEIDFRNGLTTITGETGAGKSILLGALSLILGKRADTSVLYDKKKKCIVEGTFDIRNYHLADLFQERQIDYDDFAILRREVSSAGKSRAFINDSPVTLETITELGLKLIDIHSQYQTLNLANSLFQMKVIDSYAQNQEFLYEYQTNYHDYQRLKEKLEHLTQEANRSKSDLDYLLFQYNQLEDARLSEGEQEELESELEKLSHAEEIKNGLSYSIGLFQEETTSVLQQLKECRTALSQISKFLPEISDLHQRIESSYIELKDVAQELDAINQKVFVDPGRLNLVRERLDLIYLLQQKHHRSTIAELIALKNDLYRRIAEINTSDHTLGHLQQEIDAMYGILNDLASKISSRRNKILNAFEVQITEMLHELAIPNAAFKVVLEQTETFNIRGKDKIQFLFTANKNTPLQEISKVASGGELSRLMLSIKSLMSDLTGLPTIIFDEIDTGVSGEVAEKVGNIIYRMAEHMQIINITHLPQIASKGNDHYLVYKTDEGESTITRVKLLSENERHYEIARMLSGEEVTSAALENARILLGN
ncbi:MAG: DNA repair protein RecN [Bacteroidales bacterium]|nr:DNA repair protein RecN [Bacteroidales bacterium]